MTTWIQELRSFSYVAALPDRDRRTLVRQIADLLHDHAATGVLSVPYRTDLWTARKARGQVTPSPSSAQESNGAVTRSRAVAAVGSNGSCVISSARAM